MNLYLRGDSGFADGMIYEHLESYGVSYAVRLKESGRLRTAAEELVAELCEIFKLYSSCPYQSEFYGIVRIPRRSYRK